MVINNPDEEYQDMEVDASQTVENPPPSLSSCENMQFDPEIEIDSESELDMEVDDSDSSKICKVKKVQTQ